MTKTILRAVTAALVPLSASFYFAPSAAAPAPTLPAEFSAFNVAAVTDNELSGMRGSYLPRGTVSTLADVQARDDFRQTSAVGTLTFDNWFNDVGNALIYSNILARQQ